MKNDLKRTIEWDKEVTGIINRLPGPILIIGGSGFIGANLFYALRRYREDVIIGSRKPQYSWRLFDIKQTELYNINIIDYENVKKVLHSIQPKIVFNLSSYGGYERQKDADKIHLTNYIGAINLIRCLYEMNCDAFIQAGSSSEYGLNCVAPGENAECVPNSDYSVSKIATSYAIKYYGRILQFPCLNLRLYSIYGPWEERDRLIPTIINHGLEGKLPNFVGRNVSRDFVFIDDCIEAMIRAAFACKTNSGLSINIASGKKTTIGEIAEISRNIFKISDKPIFKSMPNRKWDLANWYGKSELAKKILKWRARTSLREGLEKTIKWEKIYRKYSNHIKLPTFREKISIIIACYKDDKSIPILYERITNIFNKINYDYEIIFVNDGSPANDESIIENIANKDFHVIGVSHSRNFGSQSAFISGMGLASGSSVVLMDGDGQDPPELIPQFIDKWKKGYDIVYGERVKRQTTIIMQILYKLFYRIFAKMAEVKIPLDAGDFSLIDMKVVQYLLGFPEKDVFLRGLRAWVGFKQTGVPYQRPERLFGTSTNSFFKNILWAKKAIFSFSSKPLHYLQTFGVAMFLVSMSLIIFYIINYLYKGSTDARGITTIVLLVLSLGSIQIITISIIGDYIAKIIEEVKNRPKYIRAKIIHNGRIYKNEDEIKGIIEKIRGKYE